MQREQFPRGVFNNYEVADHQNNRVPGVDIIAAVGVFPVNAEPDAGGKLPYPFRDHQH